MENGRTDEENVDTETNTCEADAPAEEGGHEEVEEDSHNNDKVQNVSEEEGEAQTEIIWKDSQEENGRSPQQSEASSTQSMNADSQENNQDDKIEDVEDEALVEGDVEEDKAEVECDVENDEAGDDEGKEEQQQEGDKKDDDTDDDEDIEDVHNPFEDDFDQVQMSSIPFELGKYVSSDSEEEAIVNRTPTPAVPLPESSSDSEEGFIMSSEDENEEKKLDGENKSEEETDENRNTTKPATAEELDQESPEGGSEPTEDTSSTRKQDAELENIYIKVPQMSFETERDSNQSDSEFGDTPRLKVFAPPKEMAKEDVIKIEQQSQSDLQPTTEEEEDDEEGGSIFSESKETVKHVDYKLSGETPKSIGREERESFSSSTAVATIKFALNDKETLTKALPINMLIGDVKLGLADDLSVPPEVICILESSDSESLGDQQALFSLGIQAHQVQQLQVKSLQPDQFPLHLKKKPQQIAPDVITVKIPSGKGEYKTVVVEVENQCRRKPYIGGYRNKHTGAEYHHAATQAFLNLKPISDRELYSRETQTVFTRNVSNQTCVDVATQMPKSGVYISQKTDHVIIPRRPYATAAQVQETMETKAIILQSYWRRWLAKRKVQQIKFKKEQRPSSTSVRRNRGTQGDVSLLYSRLDIWRKEQIKQINRKKSGAERRLALCDMLDQEREMVAFIEKEKAIVTKENHEKIFRQLLNKATSTNWEPGGVRRMKTENNGNSKTIKQLRNYYNNLSITSPTIHDRIALLNSLKNMANDLSLENNWKLAKDLSSLAEREVDLLKRDVKIKHLYGLRKRILTLLSQVMKELQTNPKISTRFSSSIASAIDDVHFCPSCTRYLPSSDFTLSANSRVVGKCRQCRRSDEDNRRKVDMSLYRYMLRMLRESEREQGNEDSSLFKLQDTDMRHLVRVIWNGQSALSGMDNPNDLILCRWIHEESWSPWNCVLLTFDEAKSHKRVVDFIQMYKPTFLQKVKHKHNLARNYFSPGDEKKERSVSSGASVY